MAVELLVRVLVHQGIVVHRRFPTSATRVFWDDLDPHFGVWHYPNARFEHETACFSVTYETNSSGARDIERDRRSRGRPRVVVLGDSFVEGYGVQREQRVSDILERTTGTEHLNFGTSGDFGSIQEWLLYEKLASGFEHSSVYLFMLPDNDFTDNRIDHHVPQRYRPYLRRQNESFELDYPAEFGGRRPVREYSTIKRLRRHLYNGIYSLNLIRVLSADSPSTDSDRVPYDDFDDEDAEMLIYSYGELVRRAAPREVTIFVIPRRTDLVATVEGRSKGRVLALLREFADHTERVQIVDLRPYFLAYAEREGVSFAAFFHSCDGHWSPLGHSVAAQAVLEHSRSSQGQASQGQGSGSTGPASR